MKRRNFLQVAAGTTLAAAGQSIGYGQSTGRKTVEYVQVDVFTKNPLEGNPLCAYIGADNLTDDEMQRITREMNHSETTFLQASKGNGDGVVRIFTQGGETPFAGHPTLGSAFVMAQMHPGKSPLKLEEKVGPIPVVVDKRSDGMYLEMTQNDPKFLAKATDLPGLAKSLGFGADELDSRYTPQVVTTGSAFLIVTLKSTGTLERLTRDARLTKEQRDELKAGPYYVVTGENEIEARLLGAASEDPATGSAAGCATSFLVQYGRCKPDVQFVIKQGRLAKRPSFIYANASLSGGQVHNVRIGGYVVEVMRGKLTL
jgi:trans-2,3-dihydro-3-hydroxyanthranilate isomerase